MKLLIGSIVLGSIAAAPVLAQPVAVQDKTAPASSANPAIWTLNPISANSWVTRLRHLCPEQGWKVFARGNDIIVERIKPVGFSYYQFNLPAMTGKPTAKAASESPNPSHKKQYRLTFRFSPLLSQDEYDILLAKNEANRKIDFQLRRKYRVSTKFDQHYTSSDKDGQERLRLYNAESAKLVFHSLPDLYCTDYSVDVYTSWSWSEYLDDDTVVLSDCDRTRTRITKPFGLYDATTSTERDSIGTEERELSAQKSY